MTTHINHPTASVQTPFIAEEIRALDAVRLRFQQDHDVLSARERARLCFLRWLVRGGRLVLSAEIRRTTVWISSRPVRRGPEMVSKEEEHAMTHVISQDGTAIGFERSGDGSALVVVAGASADRSAGRPLAALLAPHFRVYNYDRRGRGESGDTMRGKPLPTDRWPSVTLPTLVMDGGASPEVFHSAARALVDILPKAQRRTLEGQTHGVAAEILAPVLEEFFAG